MVNFKNKILDLMGLTHKILALEAEPHEKEELLQAIRERNAILNELPKEEINQSGFLTPTEKEALIGIKQELTSQN